MDVVEAIDAWIDDEIDHLTDNELEIILEILDAVAASSLANVDVDHVYDDDIAELVDLAGGSAEDRTYTNTVLRAALLDESAEVTVDVASEQPDLEDHNDDDLEIDAYLEEELDLDDDFDEVTLGPGPDARVDDEDLDDEPVDDEDLDLDDEAVDDDSADDGHRDFISEVAAAETVQLPVAASEPTIRPVELREFDELGPSFLPEVSESAKRRRGPRLSDVLLPTFMIVGLAVFAFGMVQLINSLNEEDGTVGVAATEDVPTPTATPGPTPEPTEPPAPTATLDPSEPTPTPTPVPPPAPRVGILLRTGDIVLASFPEAGGPPEVVQLYDASDEGLETAQQVTWLANSLGVVDNDGNVLVVDPDARQLEPTIVYQAGDGLGAAVKIAGVDEQVVVLTSDGNISLTPHSGRADPDAIQVVWDAIEEGARATDLTAVGPLIPFVLDNGDARMVLTNDDNAILPIWTAEDQPEAFNVGGSSAGVLLGVGQGAVARFSLDPDDDEPLVSVWDPFSREDAPAIGYSSVGDGTAIVTGDGAIVLSDGDGGGPVLWDPELTEIRAFTALGSDTNVVVLLETGSVVQVPVDSDELIESIWDITDETLSPAIQVVLEPVTN